MSVSVFPVDCSLVDSYAIAAESAAENSEPLICVTSRNNVAQYDSGRSMTTGARQVRKPIYINWTPHKRFKFLETTHNLWSLLKFVGSIPRLSGKALICDIDSLHYSIRTIRLPLEAKGPASGIHHKVLIYKLGCKFVEANRAVLNRYLITAVYQW